MKDVSTFEAFQPLDHPTELRSQILRILVFNSFFPPAFLGGGPIRTLAAMLAAAPGEYDTAVITTNTDLGRKEPLEVIPDTWLPFGAAHVYYCSMNSWRSYWASMREARNTNPDVVYLNSFFDSKFSILPQALFILNWLRPSVLAIAPRGEFSAGALAIKAWKKKIFIGLFKLTPLPQLVYWHASAPEEEADIRRVIGYGARVVIREDDTLLPHEALAPQVSAERPLRAVSLSRLSPKKGIHTLLEGLQQVSSPMELDIIGPPEDNGYYQRCQRIAEELPPFVRVNFLGPVPHSEVRGLLNTYDVMLCPTKGENFGHVIAEALSASCPVMCADVTPWTQRLAAGGGVVVASNTAAGWKYAVNDYALKAPAVRLERRVRAQETYNSWRSSDQQKHFFSLLEESISSRSK